MIKTRLAVSAIVIAATAVPCAYNTSPLFLVSHIPEQTNTRFVAGQLGIISPDLRARYELIAWRYLAGLPLDFSEQQSALIEHAVGNVPTPVDAWRKAIGKTKWLFPWKQSRIAPGEFYSNCLDDAFITALKTLNDRRQKYSDSKLVADWIAAQDAVFENCSQEPANYPADPDPALPPLAKSDRLYQIAAAHFYAEDLDGAEARFRAIAASTDSPWKTTAAYMVGRTLLREASLLHRSGAIEAARVQLEKVHGANLLRRIEAIQSPSTAFTGIAANLAAPHPGADFENSVADGVFVLTANSYRRLIDQADTLPEPFEWVRAFDSRKSPHAVERWRATHALPWLAAALVNVKPDDAAVPDLIEAGLAVPQSSPGFDTAHYHAVRLLIARGDKERALTALDPVLEKNARPLFAVDNAYRAERMQLARDFKDFLHWAPRHPIGYEEEYVGSDQVDHSEVLDKDSVDILNHSTALPVLADTAEHSELPQPIKDQIAIMVWTRGWLKDDVAIANRMLPLLSKANPKWTADINLIRNAPAGEQKFRGAIFVERHSELRPDLEVRFLNEPPYSAWWCPAQTELSPVVISWAKAHPTDPFVPEALGRLVRVTRYGCFGVAGNGVISKQAFDLLHQKYPNDKWTKETPYWFK